MMMNCFCRMVDRQKVFTLIPRRDHCHRCSASQISNTPRAGFEPPQNLGSGFVERSCAVVITTTTGQHMKNLNVDYGCDNLSLRMVTICSKSLTLPLKLIFNSILHEGVFPETWKKNNAVNSKMITSCQTLSRALEISRNVPLISVCGF